MNFSLWLKHSIEKERKSLKLQLIFGENSKSKPLASLNQSKSPVCDNLAYVEDPAFIA